MILLDTHALVLWVSDPARFPAKARSAVDAAIEAEGSLAVSSISLWEIALLVARRRLVFTIDAETWIARVEALPFLTFVPVDNRVAIRAGRLEGFTHRDTADRIIVATALSLGAVLVTADARLRGYKPVVTLWD